MNPSVDAVPWNRKKVRVGHVSMAISQWVFHHGHFTMVIYGYIYIYGYIWLYTIIHGYIWLYIYIGYIYIYGIRLYTIIYMYDYI